MKTSSSRGAELRFKTQTGGEDIAAFTHFRKDSDNNFNIELHVPNLVLLKENGAQAAQNINEFFESARAEMIKALGLSQEEQAMSYPVDSIPNNMIIGKQLEKNANSFVFDISAWLAEYPDIVCTIGMISPEGGLPFPLSGVVQSDKLLTWTVKNDATRIPGKASIVISGSSGDIEVKSAKRYVVVKEGHPASGATPAEVEDWATEAAADEASRKIAETQRGAAYSAAEGQRNSSYAAAEGARDTLYGNAETARGVLYGQAENTRNASYVAAEEVRNAVVAKIDGMTTDAHELVPGTAPTAVISEVAGAKHISFGIPKGERGDSGNEGAYEKDSGITLGPELVDDTGWTTAGWTGDFASGFIHTVGQGTPLRRTMPATGYKRYLIEFDIESTVNTGSPDASRAFTVTIGNCSRPRLYRLTGNEHFKLGLQSVSDGDLVFQPCSPTILVDSTEFVGTIKNISVREITAITETNLAIKDINGDVATEYRQTPLVQGNVFYGKYSGAECLNNGGISNGGDGNTGVGFEALAKLTSGFWNTAIGHRALYQNRHGSRNIAIGTYALKDTTTATRCIAIGTFGQEKNVNGFNNISIGADSLQYATTGSNKIAIGIGVLGADNGNGGVAIGYQAGANSANFNYGVAIGAESMPLSTGYGNVAIGRYALRNKTAGDENVAIGLMAMCLNVEGIRNVAIGSYAVYGTAATNYSNCIFIGRYAGASNMANDGVMIGYGAGINVTNGATNVLIGKNAGSNLTTGGGNIIIGNGTQAEAETSYDTLKIGSYLSGRNVTSKWLLGVNVASPEAALHLPAGEDRNYGAPLKLTAGPLLTGLERGAIEYDGTNLYFTDSTNTRHQLAVVA